MRTKKVDIPFKKIASHISLEIWYTTCVIDIKQSKYYTEHNACGTMGQINPPHISSSEQGFASDASKMPLRPISIF